MSSLNEWRVYILKCADESLYTGITTDLERRIREHNSDKMGAKYTRARRPVSLVYFEVSSSRSDAAQREAEIKKFSRQQKLIMIGHGILTQS